MISGEKLAKIELNLMTTIKGLRAKQKEDATTIANALAKAEKAERQANDLRAQLKRANEVERKNVERLKGMYKIEAANEALRREKEAAQVTYLGEGRVGLRIDHDYNVADCSGRGEYPCR
jgi:hypothetical protein